MSGKLREGGPNLLDPSYVGWAWPSKTAKALAYFTLTSKGKLHQ